MADQNSSVLNTEYGDGSPKREIDTRLKTAANYQSKTKIIVNKSKTDILDSLVNKKTRGAKSAKNPNAMSRKR